CEPRWRCPKLDRETHPALSRLVVEPACIGHLRPGLTHMPIENELIQNVLEHSLNDFFAAEGESIASGVSERNCCARLAMHMQQHANSAGLEGYFADAEYDRKQGGQIKTILNDKMEEIVIISDLILHSRGANVA